jgi:two-component system, sensor histidine kinase PdtaS
MKVEGKDYPPAVDALALALVRASSVPVLLLDGDLTVIAASDSFCYAFQMAPGQVPERTLAELGRGEWDSPQVRALLRSTMLGYTRAGVYEMEIKRKDREPRRLVLNAVKLETGDPKLVRVLFSVTDISGEVAAEALRQKLLLEKEALERERSHRIANGLQIVTSVVLQAGRDLRWRRDPRDVALSMAAVERDLGPSIEGEVEISAYLRQLCDTLAAAMIEDAGQVTLTVEADYDLRSAQEATSLGLIVTELVINALRHAFPDGRAGRIMVQYEVEAGDWSLAVSDDGVGTRQKPVPTGLGTSVIEVLARKLHAESSLSSGPSGTTASVASVSHVTALVPRMAAAGR